MYLLSQRGRLWRCVIALYLWAALVTADVSKSVMFDLASGNGDVFPEELGLQGASILGPSVMGSLYGTSSAGIFSSVDSVALNKYRRGIEDRPEYDGNDNDQEENADTELMDPEERYRILDLIDDGRQGKNDAMAIIFTECDEKSPDFKECSTLRHIAAELSSVHLVSDHEYDIAKNHIRMHGIANLQRLKGHSSKLGRYLKKLHELKKQREQVAEQTKVLSDELVLTTALLNNNHSAVLQAAEILKARVDNARGMEGSGTAIGEQLAKLNDNHSAVTVAAEALAKKVDIDSLQENHTAVTEVANALTKQIDLDRLRKNHSDVENASTSLARMISSVSPDALRDILVGNRTAVTGAEAILLDDLLASGGTRGIQGVIDRLAGNLSAVNAAANALGHEIGTHQMRQNIEVLASNRTAVLSRADSLSVVGDLIDVYTHLRERIAELKLRSRAMIDEGKRLIAERRKADEATDSPEVAEHSDELEETDGPESVNINRRNSRGVGQQNSSKEETDGPEFVGKRDSERPLNEDTTGPETVDVSGDEIVNPPQPPTPNGTDELDDADNSKIEQQGNEDDQQIVNPPQPSIQNGVDELDDADKSNIEQKQGDEDDQQIVNPPQPSIQNGVDELDDDDETAESKMHDTWLGACEALEKKEVMEGSFECVGDECIITGDYYETPLHVNDEMMEGKRFLSVVGARNLDVDVTAQIENLRITWACRSRISLVSSLRNSLNMFHVDNVQLTHTHRLPEVINVNDAIQSHIKRNQIKTEL